jgi:hypothetical protein
MVMLSNIPCIIVTCPKLFILPGTEGKGEDANPFGAKVRENGQTGYAMNLYIVK